MTLMLVPKSDTRSSDQLEQSLQVSELLDERTLARQLGVSVSTLQTWRYLGRGPRYLKVGRLVRYRNVDIDAYIAANLRGSG